MDKALLMLNVLMSWRINDVPKYAIKIREIGFTNWEESRNVKPKRSFLANSKKKRILERIFAIISNNRSRNISELKLSICVPIFLRNDEDLGFLAELLRSIQIQDFDNYVVSELRQLVDDRLQRLSVPVCFKPLHILQQDVFRFFYGTDFYDVVKQRSSSVVLSLAQTNLRERLARKAPA